MPSIGRSARGGRSVAHTPWEYITRPMCETPAMVDAVALRTTIPGPWGPIHVAATRRGIVAVGWGTTEGGVRGRGGAASASARRGGRERRPQATPGRRSSRQPSSPSKRCWRAARGRTGAVRPGRPAGLGPGRPPGGGRDPMGPHRELWRDRPPGRRAAGRPSGRRRRRAQPGQPADPLPSGHRRGRHARRLRRRRAGSRARPPSNASATCFDSKGVTVAPPEADRRG